MTVREFGCTDVDEVLKEAEFPTHLSDQHLKDLEAMARDVEIFKLKMATEEQALANLKLSLKVLESNIEKQQRVVSQRHAEYTTADTRFSEYKKKVWPLYGFGEKDALGYHPATGEILKEQ